VSSQPIQVGASWLTGFPDVRDPKDVWADFHIVDGRVVTGMNPQSAKSTAQAAVKAFGVEALS
jgi:putative intracellular protease/amidase